SIYIFIISQTKDHIRIKLVTGVQTYALTTSFVTIQCFAPCNWTYISSAVVRVSRAAFESPRSSWISLNHSSDPATSACTGPKMRLEEGRVGQYVMTQRVECDGVMMGMWTRVI